MKRVVLVSGHYLGSKRRAGFHWLAEAFHDAGWDVIFITAPLSWLSWLRRDHRFQYPVRREANRLRRLDDRLASYVWMTRWHPANLRFQPLNRLFDTLFERYADMPLGDVESLIADADLVIFESTPALLLFDRIRLLAPDARIVYRVSDDLRVLQNHPVVLKTENRIVPEFDLVSVPCRFLLQRFNHEANVQLHPHGLRKDLFDRQTESPFDESFSRHLVFVGNARFDHAFLQSAHHLFPQWAFHIVGPMQRLVQAKNVFGYGEMPFDETVPFVQHADIGLHTIRYQVGAESFTDTLKVIQYSYCGLPILVPDFLKSSRTNFFAYTPDNEHSIRTALTAAERFNRAPLDVDDVISWTELAEALAGEPLCSEFELKDA